MERVSQTIGYHCLLRVSLKSYLLDLYFEISTRQTKTEHSKYYIINPSHDTLFSIQPSPYIFM
jgi:hypothetical protein